MGNKLGKLMKTKKFGNTSLDASAVVFGGGFVGGIIIDADDETRRQAIRMALDGGINWIDTASMYGQGKSEAALGWLLREVDDDPIVSTKVNLDTGRLDDIVGQFERSMEQSLTRLSRDSVDVLHLHNRLTRRTQDRDMAMEHVLKPGGALDALEAMQAKGLTRYIGITALGDAACCQQIVETGRVQSAQVYYNMINPSAACGPGHDFPGQDFSGLLAACQKHGVGTMGIRVFAAGILATDVRHGREVIITDETDVASEEQRAREAFAKLGIDEDGNTPYGTRAQTALRYNLAEPTLDCTVVGLAQLSHLEEVLGAAEAGPLPADAIARLG